MEGKKMRFYCVNVELYDYGCFKCCVTGSFRKEKPKNQYRQVYGMEAFKIWYLSRQTANNLKAMIENGGAHRDDIMLFYMKERAPYVTLANFSGPLLKRNEIIELGVGA
jgi:hypothetical protein